MSAFVSFGSTQNSPTTVELMPRFVSDAEATEYFARADVILLPALPLGQWLKRRARRLPLWETGHRQRNAGPDGSSRQSGNGLGRAQR